MQNSKYNPPAAPAPTTLRERAGTFLSNVVAPFKGPDTSTLDLDQFKTLVDQIFEEIHVTQPGIYINYDDGLLRKLERSNDILDTVELRVSISKRSRTPENVQTERAFKRMREIREYINNTRLQTRYPDYHKVKDMDTFKAQTGKSYYRINTFLGILYPNTKVTFKYYGSNPVQIGEATEEMRGNQRDIGNLETIPPPFTFYRESEEPLTLSYERILSDIDDGELYFKDNTSASTPAGGKRRSRKKKSCRKRKNACRYSNRRK